MSGTLQPPKKSKAPSPKATAEIVGGAKDDMGDSIGKASAAAAGPPPGPPPGGGGSGPPPPPGAGQPPSAAPGQGPPSGPPSPGGGPNPAMLAMFAKAAGGGAGAPPPGAGPAGPPPGAGGPPPGGLNPMEAQKLASMGRNGDTLLAHLTPGEIEIPPQLQNPALIKELTALFHRHGVDISQFTAGSPQSAHNPATHVPEYNFLSALLPSLLGIGGGVLGTAVGGPMGGMAGAALGSGAGTAFGGGNAAQIGLSALGGGLGQGVGGGTIGSLWGGGAGDAAAGALGGVGQAAASPGIGAGMADALGPQSLGGMSSAAAGTSGSLMDQLGGAWNTKAALGAAFGGAMGGSLAAPTAKAPQLNSTDQSFGNNMPAVNSQGNYQQLLGNNGAPTTPSFYGYNPYLAATGNGYNFFPKS